MKTARLSVGGMTCEHCAQAVEKALTSQAGVRNATVSLDSSTAEVEFEEARVAPEQLIASIEEAGYEASLAG